MEGTRSKIAIVGIAAQLPSGVPSDTNLDYKSFFQFLLEKGEAYECIPEDRFNLQFIRGDTTGKILTNTGAFLKHLDQFDYLEFGVTAKDARLMPLSTRKLIEVAFLSLQDSGIDYRGKNIGCYVSGVAHDFFSVSGHDDVEAKGAFSYAPASVANRVSYHLDLRGPSIPVDTACSSTLHATHLALQALRTGECNAAIVGGCQLNHRFADWLIYTQGGILSPDGKCKPFDASANGFGRGEGAVAIVLKPLDEAIRDHDHIYATILGTGINSSGSIAPVNAPVASAQEDAMRRAFDQTDRKPEEVDFIELHATGTAQGDPTEANWVGEQFGRDDELVIGSVKGNIGHLEISAFLASLCKVCGILETGLIPPQVNFSSPNPAIRWSEYRFRVPQEIEKLGRHSSTRPPLIAMTSSGIGGANGHCVVEGAPDVPSKSSSFWTDSINIPTLLLAGGLSPRSVAAVGDSLAGLTVDDANGLARIFGRRVRSMTWRSFAVTQGGNAPKFSEAVMASKVKPPIVFVFSGQGTQHFHMGRDLFRSCTPFRTSILELDKVYATLVGSSLIETTGLFINSDTTDPLGDPWPIHITLPALTMLQLALVDTLAAVGLTPDIVIGHSAGETAVLSASGAGSKVTALELAIARGRAFSVLEETKGAMAAVSCTPTEARLIIAEVNAELGMGSLEIGCYNSPGAVTLSGAETHIDLAVLKANNAGVFARKLRTRVPVHSDMMQLCHQKFVELVDNVFSHHSVSSPHVEMYSTVTGELFTESFSPHYFWDGTRLPVQFEKAIMAIAAKHKHAAFVEIGPHPALASYILSMTGKNTLVTCPLRRQRVPKLGEEATQLLTSLGSIILSGHNCVDFDTLYGDAMPFTGQLPRYPFADKTVPWSIPTAQIVRQRQHRHGPLNYPQLRVNVQTHPDLADHIIKGEPIMPATGFIEMALEFGASAIFDMEFHGLLPLSLERPVPVDVKLDGTKWSVRSASSEDYYKTWPIQYNRLHATGYLSLEPAQDLDVSRLNLASLRERMERVDMNGFYDRMRSFAQFGPMYRRIQGCYLSRDSQGAVEVLTEVRAYDDDIPNFLDYRLHPAVLDSAIHAMVHPFVTGNYDKDFYHLPSRVAKARVSSGLSIGMHQSVVYGYARLVKWSPRTITYDVIVTDQEGTAFCSFEGFEVALHGYRAQVPPRRYDVVYQPLGVSLLREQGAYTLQRPSRFSSDADPVEYSSSAWSLEALDTSGDCTAALCSSQSPVVILRYLRGEEMKLQAAILSHAVSVPLTLLFIAQDDLYGDGALGFTRSLRKEYPGWTVRLVQVLESWTSFQVKDALEELLSLDVKELEMKMDANGTVLIPRIQLADPPSPYIPQLDAPWRLDNGKIVQTQLPCPTGDNVVVHVTSVSQDCDGLWSYVGECDDRIVIGISAKPLCSDLEVHKGTIVEIDDQLFAGTLAQGPSVLPSTILTLAVGVPSFSHPERLRGVSVLVFDRTGQLGARIRDICIELGMHATLITSMETAQLEPFYLKKPNVILSSTHDASDTIILRSILSSNGRMLLWNSPTEGVLNIAQNDPWKIGDAARSGLVYCRASSLPLEPYAPPNRSLSLFPVSVHPNLFDSRKCYLLIGGIGSLGLHVALWMYENGARHLIMTSRSGTATLDKASDWVAQRIWNYLRSRDDFTLEMTAVDATSQPDMDTLIRNISTPLGGCMLMSTLLEDRTLGSHTLSSFERVFPPKVQAFITLERALDLDSLDFVVTFSSVSAMFGNPGQTNYATANTILARMTLKYKNAFSLVCPAVTDSRLATTTDLSYQSRLRHLNAWGMSGREICDYIGDGIRKLRDNAVRQYIPDFDWQAVQKNIGPSQLYDHLVPDDGEGAVKTDGTGKPNLLDIVCRVLGMKVEDISVDVPLTGYGLDSLSAASLSFALRPLLSVSQIQLLADLNIKDLQTKMQEGGDDPSSTPSSAGSQPVIDTDTVASHVQQMEVLLSQFSAGLSSFSSVPSTAVSRDPSMTSVVVTGTTGSLGAHVLAHLLQYSEYKKVYALLRPSKDGIPAMERQVSSFVARGLDPSSLSSPRLVVITCDLELKSLGVSRELYEEIRLSVSHIVHIGWPINLQAPLSSFKSALMGLRTLIDLARDAREFGLVNLVYGSSLGIFRNYTSVSLPKEDAIVADVAVGAGYPESKWIAERLLRVASEKKIARSTILRIGQLTGGANGAWNVAEWFPSIVCASAALRCLPQGQGVVSWLPVNTAAIMIADMMTSKSTFTIFHLRHPRPMSLADIMQHLSDVLKLPLVPYVGWLSKLSDAMQSPGPDIATYASPAIRLLQLFQSTLASQSDALNPEKSRLAILMDIEYSAQHCALLRDPSLPQIGVDDVRTWVEYWRRVGSLPL